MNKTLDYLFALGGTSAAGSAGAAILNSHDVMVALAIVSGLIGVTAVAYYIHGYHG